MPAGQPNCPRPKTFFEKRSEQDFDRELTGTRTADLIERTQYTKLLVERLGWRPETGELVDGEHWVVEEVEVLHPEEQARALAKMKLAAEGKVGLVDGESAEEVARQVSVLARRCSRKARRVQRSTAGFPGSGQIEGHPGNNIGTCADEGPVRRRCADANDAICLPISQQSIAQPLPMERGYLPGDRCRERVAHIEVRWSKIRRNVDAAQAVG